MLGHIRSLANKYVLLFRLVLSIRKTTNMLGKIRFCEEIEWLTVERNGQREHVGF
jgi:hypothetical protein